MSGAAELVVALAAVRPDDASRVGGKAAGLAALLAAGFRVPAGFVLTTDALTAGEPEVRAALSQALAALGDGPWAVRSSAIGEDSAEASFAGQYETVLDVPTADGVFEAVRRCWRSGESSRLAQYRAQLGEDQAPRMAIVVQRMVRPEAAGVAFSANPVTGDRDEVLVSAVRGLGERLVSGESAPDEWSVRGDQVEARRAVEHALDDPQVRAVANAARAVAAQLGGPQDLEWAFAGGELWLLQARPITALPDEVEWAAPLPGGWHRNFRLGEWLPEPVTPLFHSWLLPRLEDGFNAFYGRHCGVTAAGPNHVLIHGWYFGSLNFVPSPPAMIWQLLTRMLPRLLVGGRRALALFPPLHPRCIELFVEDWRALLPRYRAAAAASLERATSETLFNRVEALAALAAEYFALISMVGGYGWKTELPLARFCRTHLGTSHQELLCGLFTPKRATHDVLSIDWCHPTLGELPEEAEDPVVAKRVSQLEAARAAAEARARDALASRSKLSKKFEGLLAEAQRFCRLREEIVSQFTLPWPSMRRAVTQLGEAAVRAGALDSAADVHFLTLEELRALLSASSASAPDVARRRATWQRERRLAPPLVVGTAPKMLEKMFADSEAAFRGVASTAALASGLGASPGRATGTVRIIRQVSEFARFRDGDVLVAKATTPAWTVLFPRASAVVTDIGSVIAHSALVAREYGIPAVVGTGNATLVLRDGQRVVVDGTQGQVFLAPGGTP